MSADGLKALGAALRSSLEPMLASHGFSFEPGTRTFRRAAGDCTQILNVQVGVRSMEGRFTVNLGVFHPQYNAIVIHGGALPDKPLEYQCVVRERLSVLRDTILTRYFRPRIEKKDTFLKFWLTTPTDEWWRFSSSEAQITSELAAVQRLLLERGLPWLQQHSDVAVLKGEYAKLKPLASAPRGLA